MSAGSASALIVLRVPRGAPRPNEAELQAAIERDRARLHASATNSPRDLRIAGPYRITVDGQDLDEYVIWDV